MLYHVILYYIMLYYIILYIHLLSNVHVHICKYLVSKQFYDTLI